MNSESVDINPELEQSEPAAPETKIKVRDLNLYYGDNHALHNVDMDIYQNKITALIGP